MGAFPHELSAIIMSETLAELQTIADYIRWGASRFIEHQLCFGHGTDNALDEARLLVLHTLHLPFGLPDSYLHTRLTAREREAVSQILQRRFRERLPASYLTNEAWFAGLPFYVDDRVLVPRSPLAELIETHFEPWIMAEQIESVLDLCTGSGCIGIATALYLEGVQVDLADVSKGALEVAAKNIEKHQVEDRVTLIESDLFANLQGRTYDVIVSNPPYVDAEDMAMLPEEYCHEPELGLTGGDDGLDLVAIMLAEARSHLNDGGILVVEVGNSAPALEARYPEVPFTWLDFERGGEGVFLLTAQQLDEYAAELAQQ